MMSKLFHFFLRPQRFWRAISIGILVFLLHGLGMSYFMVMPIQSTKSEPLPEIQLLPPQPVVRSNSVAPARRLSRLRQRVRPSPAILTAPPPVVTTQSDLTSDALPDDSATSAPSSLDTVVNEPSEKAAALENTAPAPAVHSGDPFSLPPSATMVYTAYINGMRNQDSQIRWFSDGSHYRLDVEIPLPFVGTFSYRSMGNIDDYGLAPVRYEEARGKKASVATNFNRDARQTISFSRVTTELPLPAGAQDRFSLLWQLVSLVRGAPQRDTPGVTRVFYVADTDQGESWRIQTLGEESIELPQGWVNARHFLRLPRHEDDARKLEVWLAEDLGWVPVKIRQTEPSGQTLELVLKASQPMTGE